MSFVPPFTAPLGNNANARVVSVQVMNDNEPTRKQLTEAEFVFNDHMRTVGLSLAGYHVEEERMSDGSVVRIVSNGGQHAVMLWPAAPDGKVRYSLLPAFWLNQPHGSGGFGTVDSATWKRMPYDETKLPILKENHRIKHPGNRTWFDSRADSKTKGLVLSWWGLSKDRYGNMFGYPATQADPSPDGYRRLYCNGVLIGEFEVGSGGSGNAIYGACIAEVEGKLKVCVLTCSHLRIEVNMPPLYTLMHYNSYAQGLSGGVAHSGISRLTLNLWQADLPGEFASFRFRKLSFGSFVVAQPSIGVDQSFSLVGQERFKVGGVDHHFTQPSMWRLTGGCRINASGTAGILEVSGYADAYPGTGTVNSVQYLLIDLRTGALTGVLTPPQVPAAVAAHYEALYPGRCTVSLSGSPRYDWHEDTLVFAVAGGVSVYTDGTKTTPESNRAWGYSSVDGLLYDTDDEFYGSTISGDLRGRVIDFVDAISGQQRLYFRTTLVRAGAVTLSNTLAVGWEGADTSFDRRLVVCRSNGVVRAWADDEEITATLDGIDDFRFQDVHQPILCGPLARLDGMAEPQRQYVVGEAP